MIKKRKYWKNIQFKYYRSGNLCFCDQLRKEKEEDLAKFFKEQCCCTCKYQYLVYKNCNSTTYKKGQCICNESLNFYICALRPNHASIKSKHGLCECYRKREEE
jgi:hypothetical protein